MLNREAPFRGGYEGLNFFDFGGFANLQRKVSAISLILDILGIVLDVLYS